MKEETKYRLYTVGAGQLTKIHYGNKGFEHESLEDAKEYAKAWLQRARQTNQVVIQTGKTIVTVIDRE